MPTVGNRYASYPPYKKSFKFQNPLRQNYKHLKALEATLGIAPEHLHSVIGAGFIRYIKSFRQPVFSEAEVDALLRALQEGRRAPTLATASTCKTSNAAATPPPSANAPSAAACW